MSESSEFVCIEEDWPETPNVHQRLVVLTAFAWKPPVRLKVGFIDKPEPPADLRAHIVSHMNAWGDFCDVKFTESTNNPEVRITLQGKGYWSYIGTSILNHKHAGKETMCLEDLSMKTPESQVRRHVRHETGHTLGFLHEHLRPEVVKWIDRDKAIKYYTGPPNNWTVQKAEQNVLTPLDNDTVTATETTDLHSIMCYPIRKSILKPGAPDIPGGQDFSQFDKDFAASVYPLPIKKNDLVFSQDIPAPPKHTGSADIIGFTLNSVQILRNKNGVFNFHSIRDRAYKAFWYRDEDHRPLVADVTGNGTKDLVAFDQDGVHVAVNNADNNTVAFGVPQKVLSNFGGHGKMLRFMVDIRGTGRADLVAFGGPGVYVSKNDGNLKFTPPSLVLKHFGFDQSWDASSHLRFLGDTTGDGLPDIVVFAAGDVFVARNNGDGTFKEPVVAVRGINIGSRSCDPSRHPCTIADLTGDGMVDIVCFGDRGVCVAFNSGDGTFEDPTLVLKFFGYSNPAGYWRVQKHLRLVADLTGDGTGDLLGFGNNEVWVSINRGNGTFQNKKLVLRRSYGCVRERWSVKDHVRVLVDMNGNGRADIVGIGQKNVFISTNQGQGTFTSPDHLTEINAFTSDAGWKSENSVRFVTNVF